MRAVVLVLWIVTGVAAADPLARVAAAVEAPGDPDPPRKVIGFRVRGKTKLKVRALRYIADLREGDFVRERDRPRMLRLLISSELFERVEIAYEPAEDGVLVVVTLTDKHSWIVAPTFYVLSGQRSLGVGYAENDLLGLNQKLLLYGQIGERDSLFFGTFLDENVRGTRLTMRLDLYAYRRLVDEYENPPDDGTSTAIVRTTQTNYLGGGLLVGWNLAWWAIADLRLRGAYVFYREPRDAGGNPLPSPSPDGRDVTAQARLTLDARYNYFGVTWGPYLQILAENSVPGLDEYGYGSVLVRAYYSWKLFREHQLELRTHLNAGYHLPMHEELTLGGVIDLRGYAVDQFRGDVRTMFRTEYSVPITKIRFFALRAIGFWDTGYIGYQLRMVGDGNRDYIANQRNDASWWRNDVGVGLRIYVKRIVLPLLGLDFAYGIEGRAPEIYFQVGLTDF